MSKIMRILLFSLVYFCCILSSSANYVWQRRADFGGGVRYSTSFFSIGGKGYTGLGYDGIAHSDWWEYDPLTNIWTQKANFIGGSRWSTPAFAINNTGYVCTGTDGIYVNTCYAYSPISNSWHSVAISSPRQDAFGFTIGSKGYITCGYASVYHNDLWEFDPTLLTWSQKANFPGHVRSGLIGFVIGNVAYAGTGYYLGTNYRDFQIQSTIKYLEPNIKLYWNHAKFRFRICCWR
ncbi:MAG: hypothetical protein IPO39_12035 [Bacteroidetes bacterium]|nr:hypothetical protein [Bacteroidota bacterium]